MKRILALFLVLFMASFAVSCNRGGKTPALVSTSATEGSNHMTEQSTNITTQTSQKPIQPEHPAIAEINAAIEKTLALDSYKLTQIRTDIFSQSGKGSSLMKNRKSELCIWGGEAENFAVTGIYDYIDKEYFADIYFTEGYYYTSVYGMNVKFPEGEGEYLEDYTELHKKVTQKIVGTARPDEQVFTNYTRYEFGLDGEQADAIYSEYISFIEADFAAQKNITQCILTPKFADITVYVTTEGYVQEYRVSMTLEVFVNEDNDYDGSELSVTVDLSFKGHGEETGDMPEDPEKYTEVSSYTQIFTELFNDALGKTNALENIKTEISTALSIHNGGGSYTEILISGIREAQNLKTDPVWRESTTLISGEENSSVDIYFENGYYYVNAGGIKRKYTKEAYEGAQTASGSKILLPEHILSFEAKEYELPGGNGMLLSFEIGNEAFKEVYADYISSAISIMASGYNITGCNIQKAEVVAIINSEGYLVNYDVSYNLEIIIDINGAKFAVSAYASDTVITVNPGAPVEVAAPDGYEAYPEA